MQTPDEASLSVIHVGDRDFMPLRPLTGKAKTSTSNGPEQHVTLVMPPPKPGVPFFILLLLAVFGTLSGVVVFGLCFFSYKNYQAALWSLASGIFAAGVLHLQILHLCKKLDVWHDKNTLGGVRVLGIIVSSISVVASGTYFALVVTRGQEFSLESGNLYPSAVFSLITLVWGILLLVSAHHCQRRVQEEHPGLLAYSAFNFPNA